MTFNFPLQVVDQVIHARRARKVRSESPKRPAKTAKPRIEQPTGRVYLHDIIQAGLLRPPVTLFRRYKKHDLKATIREDGKVVFQSQDYETPSAAAEIARGTITGRPMNTNGWTFWQFTDATGNAVQLDVVRQAYLNRKAKS